MLIMHLIVITDFQLFKAAIWPCLVTDLDPECCAVSVIYHLADDSTHS